MYRFVTFAGVDLPKYNRQEEHTGGVVDSTLVATINGTFDSRGSLRAVPKRAVFTMRGILVSEVVAGSETVYWVTGGGDQMVLIGGGDVLVFTAGIAPTGVTLREQLDTLRGLIGTVGTLVREPKTGSDNQSITARLLSVRQQKTQQQSEAYAEVDLTFEAAYPYWRGTSKSANRSGSTISATNSGNAPVRDAVLTVVGTISGSVTVTGAGINFTWSGSLSSGQQLVIAGNSVTANGAPSKVTINSGHTSDVLVELGIGANTLTVTGGASASLAWYDAWQ